jgi:hypothetical protein
MFLSPAASSDYMQLTRWSFWHGVIGPDHFLDRIAMLREISRPDTYTWRCTDLLLRMEEFSAEDLPDLSDGPGAESISLRVSQVAPEDFDIYLITAVGGLSWNFHLGDDDPLPSVPHGHETKTRRPRKFDPYLGWVYHGTKQTERLSRRTIIDLWNDENFRTFATRAISVFMSKRPDFHWRVSNPLRLPRRQ